MLRKRKARMKSDPREADKGEGADMTERRPDRPLTEGEIASLRADWNKVSRGKRRKRDMRPADGPGYKTR
jgi:hypothetical protein